MTLVTIGGQSRPVAPDRIFLLGDGLGSAASIGTRGPVILDSLAVNRNYVPCLVSFST